MRPWRTRVGYEINYHVTGSLRLAHTQARVDEFRHVVSQARAQGMHFDILSPAQLREHNPFLVTDGLLAGLYDPYDGDIDPAQLTQALAKGARDGGAEVYRNTRVTAIERSAAGEWRIHTDRGSIVAEKVINAAGYRGAEVAAMVGAYLPIVTLSHQYLVTEDIPELVARGAMRLPLLRDPDVSYYLRQERHSLLLGPYEWQATAHWQDRIPEHFANQLFDDDLGRLEKYIDAACARVPILGSVGVKTVINGPIPYAPDGNPLMGPAPGLPGFYHCCAFTFGIVQAGGAGKSIAEWVVNGQPEWDMWPLDSRRYLDYANPKFVLAKAIETYQHEYGIGYPNEERAGGQAREDLARDICGCKAKGAQFGARGGWERAVYFARPGDPAAPGSFLSPARLARGGRARMRGGRRARRGTRFAGLFEVRGRGPRCARLARPSGRGRRAQTGTHGAQLSVRDERRHRHRDDLTNLGDERFWLISAAAGELHDEHWLRQHLPGAARDVRLENLSARYGTLIVVGPRARELLSLLTPARLDNEAFPWLSVRTIEIGYTKAIAVRVNYVGELGWELHLPSEHVLAVYDLLSEAGERFGLADFGLYAMDSLRLEKCYRSWKADLTTEYTPLMASLDRFVKLDKPGGFVGQAALQREAASGPRERFVPLLVDAGGAATGDPAAADDAGGVADAAAVSVVRAGDQTVGLVTSGGYGYRLRQSIALAYVRSDLARPGTALSVEILGVRRSAVVAAEPLYDPSNHRLRG